MEDEKNKEEYNSLKKSIDSDYTVKSNEAKKLLEAHWKSFNEQKKKLESIVKEDFKKIVEKFEPDGIKIEKFNVEYNPNFQSLEINVIEMQVQNKKFPFETIFAGYFDNRLDQEIKKFRDAYCVSYIGCDLKQISIFTEK